MQEVEPDQPNGMCLLLLHTAGQSGVQWRNALQALAETGYRLLVPDLPGHGHSEPAMAGAVRSLANYTDWIVQVLEILQVERPIAVGCSIGGKIAQDLAVRHGARVSAMVSMCAEPGPGRGNLRALERELEDSAAASRTDRTHLGTRAVLGRNVSDDRAALIARMHCREDPYVTNSDLIAWGTHDMRSLLHHVTCPATFVASQDDLWVNPVAVEKASQQVSNGTFIFLEGYGHYPMEEMENFAKELDGWVTNMLGRDN